MMSDVAVTAGEGVRGLVASTLLAAARAFAQRQSALDRRAASAVVFAPHPDDEVLGCGGTVALKVAAGARVRVVVMTDGRTSHAPWIDGDRLAALRRREARDAALALGLAPADYHFLDFEDGRLRGHVTAARARVAELLRAWSPEQVFVPHRRDRIADHLATFDIVRAALGDVGSPVALFEYPVWLWHGWPWTDAPQRTASARLLAQRWRDIGALAFACRARVDVRSVLARKSAALRAYRSQVERPQSIPDWPVLADVARGQFVARLTGPTEVFRESAIGGRRIAADAAPGTRR